MTEILFPGKGVHTISRQDHGHFYLQELFLEMESGISFSGKSSTPLCTKSLAMCIIELSWKWADEGFNNLYNKEKHHIYGRVKLRRTTGVGHDNKSVSLISRDDWFNTVPEIVVSTLLIKQQEPELKSDSDEIDLLVYASSYNE